MNIDSKQKSDIELVSIQIRDVKLDYDVYYMTFHDIKNDILYKTENSHKTVIPYFPIYISNKKIYNLFNNPNKEQLKIQLSLYSYTSNNLLCTYELVYPSGLLYLSETLMNIEYDKYPLIIFECTDGFYTMQEGKIDMDRINSSYAYVPQNSLGELVVNDIIELRDKSKQYDFSVKSIENEYKLLEKAKISFLEFLKGKKDNFTNYTEINKLLECISKYQKLKHNKREKIKFYKSIVDYFNEKIINKKRNIQKLNELIAETKEKNKKVQEELIPNVVKVNNKIEYINKGLYKQTLVEFSHIFFNKKLTRYISYPPFFNQSFIPETKFIRTTFYLNHYRTSSVMLGFMTCILSYLSKRLNIILPFNPYYNGTKSCLYDRKKGFTRLFKVNKIYSKNNKTYDEGADEMEAGTFFLQKMYIEITNFLKSLKLLSIDNIKRHNNDDYMEILNRQNNEENVYIVFIRFNNYLHDLLKENYIIYKK